MAPLRIVKFLPCIVNCFPFVDSPSSRRITFSPTAESTCFPAMKIYKNVLPSRNKNIMCKEERWLKALLGYITSIFKQVQLSEFCIEWIEQHSTNWMNHSEWSINSYISQNMKYGVCVLIFPKFGPVQFSSFNLNWTCSLIWCCLLK